MKVDKNAQEVDLASIPAEFRENYKFLCELINCRQKNNSVTKCLEKMAERHLWGLRGKLNRRQLKILSRFITEFELEEPELFGPPVPPELEASLRLRRRSTWLPWEAEAIRKIERWRADLSYILQSWGEDIHDGNASVQMKGKNQLTVCK